MRFAFVLCAFAGAAQADTVTLFAAASMKDSLDVVAAAFEVETGHKTVISYAGSSKLAQQIQEGAPAEIFLSASTDWMDTLAAEGLLLPESRKDLLGNSLVLVSHAETEAKTELLGADLDLKGLLGAEFLAMALVEAVPAGAYGKQALESLGLWDGLFTQVAQADDVRAALRLVATGEAPFGIVYGTDAAIDPNVHLYGTFDPATHDAIIYPVAEIAQNATEASAAFLAYLQEPQSAAVFLQYGFTVLP